MGKLVFLSIIGGGLAVLAVFLNFFSENPQKVQNDIVPKNSNPPIFPGNEGITPERLVIEHTI